MRRHPTAPHATARPVFHALVMLATGVHALSGQDQGGARPLVAVIEQGGGTSVMRTMSCGDGCRVMRMDQGDATMLITILGHEGGVATGQFAFADHKRRTVQTLDFETPALADYMIGARRAQRSALAQLFLSAELTPTGATRTITVADIAAGAERRDPDAVLELNAREYTFSFQYEVDGLPGMAEVPEEARAQLADLGFIMTMEGETWVAPEAPGAATLATFYDAMAYALGQFVQGEGDDRADMTSALTAAMSLIAAEGVPLVTRTRMSLAPKGGSGAAGMMARMMSRLMPELSDERSRVIGIGSVEMQDLGPGFSDAMRWGWRGDWRQRRGFDPEGYKVEKLEAGRGG